MLINVLRYITLIMFYHCVLHYITLIMYYHYWWINYHWNWLTYTNISQISILSFLLQCDVYKNDFEAERAAREKVYHERDQLKEEVEELKIKLSEQEVCMCLNWKMSFLWSY